MRSAKRCCGLVGLGMGVIGLPGCGALLWPSSDKLEEIAGAIEERLAAMDADLALAATAIAGSGLDSAATRATLSALCDRYPAVVDCSTVDPQGVLVAVEPEAFHDAQGADISDQPQVIEVLQEKHPVMSDLFMAVEGFPALDFEYPLLANGMSLGAVSMLFKPADYFAGIIEPLLEDTDYLCMVVQTDGVILYDVDSNQVGRDTFNDPMYADFSSLLEFARLYLSTPSGTDTYEFTDSGSGRLVTKYARWTTIRFHGAQWRVLLIREGPVAN